MNSLPLTNENVEKALYTTNNLSHIKYGNTKVWPQKFNPDLAKDFVYFESDEPNTLTVKMYSDVFGYPQYSYDNKTWEPFFETKDLQFGDDKVLFLRVKRDKFKKDEKIIDCIVEKTNKPWTVGGKLACLISAGDHYHFEGFFKDCTHMVDCSALDMDDIASDVDAYNDYGTTIYASEMFKNCTSITKPPRRTQTWCLREKSFSSMFEGCTNLESVIGGLIGPHDYSGKATNMCSSMYAGCSSLTNTMSFGVHDLNGDCDWMYSDCILLEDGGSLENVYTACYEAFAYYFNGCISLKKTIKIDHIVGSTLFKGMYKGCASLIKTGVIPLMTRAGMWMFADCTSLQEATFIEQEQTINDMNYRHMFDNCHMLKKVTGLEYWKKNKADLPWYQFITPWEYSPFWQMCFIIKDPEDPHVTIKIGVGRPDEDDLIEAIGYWNHYMDSHYHYE